MRNPKRSFPRFSTLAVGIAALTFSSCGDSDDGVRVYEVIIPEGQKTPTAPAPPSPTTQTPPAPNGDAPGLTWSAPESWTKIANANRFDRARYEVTGENGEKAIATVTSGIGGSVPMNVNRWRGQLGLGAATEDELKAAAIPVRTPDSNGVIFELAAPDGSRKILAAILPIPSDTYYYKLDGAASVVDAEREAFMAMVNSSKIGQPESSAENSAPAAEPPTLKFDTPEGWTTGSQNTASSMRSASYLTANGGEVSILLFRDSPDAIVQNINIWRREAGLDEATGADQLELTDIPTNDGKLTWKLHHVSGDELAVLAAFATVDDTLWVVRLKSTPDAVSKDKASMTQFLKSATSN